MSVLQYLCFNPVLAIRRGMTVFTTVELSEQKSHLHAKPNLTEFGLPSFSKNCVCALALAAT